MLDYTRNEIHISLKQYFAGFKNVPQATDPLFELILDIYYVLCNRDLWLPYLQELNRDIAARLQNEVLPNVPTEYISFFETKLVAYSEITCHQDQCSNELLKCLLKQEQKNGVNLGLNFDTTPVFTGQIPTEKANALVNSGYLWKDSSADPITYMHGCLSHRIQYYILTRAREDKIIFSELTQQNVPLLSHLLKNDFKVSVHLPKQSMIYHMTMWNLCFDSHYPHWRKIEVPLPTVLKNNINTNTLFMSPTVVNKVLQSEANFSDMPYLAFAILKQQYQGICAMAKSVSCAPQDIVNCFINIIQGIMPDDDTFKKMHHYRVGMNNGLAWHIQNDPTQVVNSTPAVKSGFFKANVEKKPDGIVQLQYIKHLSKANFVIKPNGEIINATATFSDENGLSKVADQFSVYKIPFIKNGLSIEIARITDLNQILRAAYEESKKTVVQKSMVGR